MSHMTAVVAKAEELNNDIIAVQRELKRVASIKCRLKKMPRRSDFEANMTAILQEEELLKCVRSYVAGPRKNVNTLTQEEVDLMTLDEAMKAIKSIQSKKYHTKWLTTTPGDNDEYREACRIEEMLKARRDALAPKSNGYISRIELQTLLDCIKACSDITVDQCIARIEQYINEEV
jgi:hypothetical protein